MDKIISNKDKDISVKKIFTREVVSVRTRHKLDMYKNVCRNGD